MEGAGRGDGGEEAVSEFHKKVWRAQYRALRDGSKTFEVRQEDHSFKPKVGDVLVLHEFNEDAQEYTNYDFKRLRRQVTYVLRHGFGLPAGMVVLGLKVAPPRRTRW